MAKISNDKETHDFMSVDSFSQLPFIRPAPVREKSGIRLFGIEFDQKQEEQAEDQTESGETTVCEETNKDTVVAEESGRKFECHYCCRNFPTSQALGGHQNAHKRERQNAKRAHLQSALAHNSHVTDSSAQVYGLANYRLGGTAPHHASSFQLGRGFEPSPYHPWHHHHGHSHYHSNINTTSNGGHRFYGTHTSSFSPQQPINGNPLPGLWRIPVVQSSTIPAFNRDRSSSSIPLPLLAGEDSRAAAIGGSPQIRHVYQSTAVVHEHVSLDLHL